MASPKMVACNGSVREGLSGFVKSPCGSLRRHVGFSEYRTSNQSAEIAALEINQMVLIQLPRLTQHEKTVKVTLINNNKSANNNIK